MVNAAGKVGLYWRHLSILIERTEIPIIKYLDYKILGK